MRLLGLLAAVVLGILFLGSAEASASPAASAPGAPTFHHDADHDALEAGARVELAAAARITHQDGHEQPSDDGHGHSHPSPDPCCSMVCAHGFIEPARLAVPTLAPPLRTAPRAVAGTWQHAPSPPRRPPRDLV